MTPREEETLAQRIAVLLKQAGQELRHLSQQGEALYQRLCAEQAQAQAAPGSAPPTEWEARLRRLQYINARLAGMIQTLDQADLAGGMAETQFPQVPLLTLTQVVQAQEEEYHRLAQEISDGVGQVLANAIFELEYCQHLLDGDPVLIKEGLNSLQAELRAGLGRARQLVIDLQPPLLAELGLPATLRQYVRDYKKTFNLDVELQLDDLRQRLPATMEVALFRVIQEALQNVVKHSAATRVTVTFQRQAPHLVFIIEDNGHGFVEPAPARSRVRPRGLAHMRQRAELLQGQLEIHSQKGRGTRVTLTVPDPFA